MPICCQTSSSEAEFRIFFCDHGHSRGQCCDTDPSLRIVVLLGLAASMALKAAKQLDECVAASHRDSSHAFRFGRGGGDRRVAIQLCKCRPPASPACAGRRAVRKVCRVARLSRGGIRGCPANRTCTALIRVLISLRTHHSRAFPHGVSCEIGSISACRHRYPVKRTI
jgi:hypothetical protein